MSVGANGVGAGGDKVSSLAGFCKAFERMRGRTLTADERREAQALVDVLVAEDMDPYMLHALVFRTELADTRAVMKQAAKQLTAATERLSGGDQKAPAEAEEGRLGAAVEAAVEAVQLLRSEAASRLESVEKVGPPAAVPTTLSPESLDAIAAAVVCKLDQPIEETPAPGWWAAIWERWPKAAKAAGHLWSMKWPVWLMWATFSLTLLVVVWVAASGAQRSRDSADLALLATPAGTAAVQLAEANPHLRNALRGCQRSVNGGRTVLSGCTFWAPTPNSLAARGKASWWTTAAAVISGWDHSPFPMRSCFSFCTFIMSSCAR